MVCLRALEKRLRGRSFPAEARAKALAPGVLKMRTITDDEWALSRRRRRRLTLSARCAWSYRLPSDLVEGAVRKVDAMRGRVCAWRDSRLRAFEEHAAA